MFYKEYPSRGANLVSAEKTRLQKREEACTAAAGQISKNIERRKVKMTDYEILRVERFGSREPIEECGRAVKRNGERNLLYIERLKRYEAEKRQLRETSLSAKDYEREIKRLADKWKI